LKNSLEILTEMELKILQKLFQKYLKKINNGFIMTSFSSLIRGMFDGRTDQFGMKI
jgi:hypothetical protein